MSGGEDNRRLVSIELATAPDAVLSPEMESERISAITELLHENTFNLLNSDSGPYDLKVSILESRFRLLITSTPSGNSIELTLALQTLRPLIKDYRIICESYFEAVKTGNTAKLEAIDMGRRGLHNEAADKLIEMLESKVELDWETARRLFTLLFVTYTKTI